jgi:hypothetical protein
VIPLGEEGTGEAGRSKVVLVICFFVCFLLPILYVQFLCLSILILYFLRKCVFCDVFVGHLFVILFPFVML